MCIRQSKTTSSVHEAFENLPVRKHVKMRENRKLHPPPYKLCDRGENQILDVSLQSHKRFERTVHGYVPHQGVSCDPSASAEYGRVHPRCFHKSIFECVYSCFVHVRDDHVDEARPRDKKYAKNHPYLSQHAFVSVSSVAQGPSALSNITAVQEMKSRLTW